MYGQGPYNSGTNSGGLAVELDDAGDYYEGTIFAVPNGPLQQPSLMGDVDNIPKYKNKVELRIPLTVISRHNGTILGKEALARDYPGVVWPEYADSEWTVGANQITVSWKTNNGTDGKASVSLEERDETSKLDAMADIKSWSQFKEYVRQFKPYDFAFRGQEDNRWPLRSFFHRTRRISLRVFSVRDVPALQRHLSSLTHQRFNLNDPFDYAAFLNLAQHHGYPTPFLDWTYSPFIAAYFAYRGLKRADFTSTRRVRVLIFNARQWNAKFERALGVVVPFRQITVLEPLEHLTKRLNR